MIEQPSRYIEQFREVGADVITVHYEAERHLHRCIQQIKATGAKAGVALNPHTPVSVLEDILEDLDLVCLKQDIVICRWSKETTELDRS